MTVINNKMTPEERISTLVDLYFQKIEFADEEKIDTVKKELIADIHRYGDSRGFGGGYYIAIKEGKNDMIGRSGAYFRMLTRQDLKQIA